MRQAFYGDSYDIVKRFFCDVLRSLGYEVHVDPMLTDRWEDDGEAFCRFLGASRHESANAGAVSGALFVDPDTGVRDHSSLHHVSFDRLARHCDDYRLVFAFDQSFSRSESAVAQMARKLDELDARGCVGCYYDSHARFLFISRDATAITEFRDALLETGLSTARILPRIT